MKNDELADGLNAAFALHQAKQLDAAEEMYRRLAAIDTENFDVHHLLGLICYEKGNYDEAEALLGKALAINPSSVDANSNYSLVLLKQGKPEAALRRLSAVLEAFPMSPAASTNYSMALVDLGRYQEALDWCDAALETLPGSFELRRNGATALFKLKRYNDALARYQALQESAPSDHQLMMSIAACYVELDRPNEAARFVADALAADPNNSEALLFEANRLEQAGQFEEALAAADAALRMSPDSATTHACRARILGQLKRYEDALKACDEALALDANSLDALFCRGVARQAMHDFEGAILEYRRVLAIEPDNPSAHWNEAYCDLTLGRLEIGFKGYEWRLRNPYLGHAPRFFEAPLWLGDFSIQGARILLHSEQGFGDTFQFLRYVALVKQLGATVVLEVPRAVRPLLVGWVPEELLLETDQSVPPIDAHCPLPSLPLALGTTEHSVPRDTPYLASDAERREAWSMLLGPKADLRVGVAWSGNREHVNDQNRSVPLETFLQAFPREVQLVALQKDLREEDQELLRRDGRISFFGAQLKNFADTAALIDMVDLVVTIDTGIAHLAAAMNKPTWILLDTVSDWRWQLNREDSPWYPSVRLIRQGQHGTWQPVMNNVHSSLKKMLPKPRGLFSLFSRNS